MSIRKYLSVFLNIACIFLAYYHFTYGTPNVLPVLRLRSAPKTEAADRSRGEMHDRFHAGLFRSVEAGVRRGFRPLLQGRKRQRKLLRPDAIPEARAVSPQGAFRPVPFPRAKAKEKRASGQTKSRPSRAAFCSSGIGAGGAGSAQSSITDLRERIAEMTAGSNFALRS